MPGIQQYLPAKWGVTAARPAHSISGVSSPDLPEPAWPHLGQPRPGGALRPFLTRRRAVDYCRVATALCLRAPRRQRQLA
ncbi:MAG: putative leader peptide [Gemmatimonadota bacterium]